jgi:hypothetical protein
MLCFGPGQGITGVDNRAEGTVASLEGLPAKAETVGIPDGRVRSAGLRPESMVACVRAPALGALLVCLVAVALPGLLGASVETGVAGRASRHQPVRGVPPSLLPAFSASVGASEPRFWPVRRGASLVAAGGEIRSTFTAAGAALHLSEGTLGLSLAGAGRVGSLYPIAGVAPDASANRAVYRHGWVRELYSNGPFGLEQGFVVRHRPVARGSSLALLVRVRGSLRPEQVGAQVRFRTPRGAIAASYGGLAAVDATGRPLPVSMGVGNGFIELRVTDRNARYPVRVDPFIEQGAKLTGGGETGTGELGSSVALSADGDTALVGAPGDGGGAGAAWVFTRSGSIWTQQGEMLTGASETGAARFGGSVALSADGDTALIGGAADGEGAGAAWAFARSGATWAQQGEKLTGAGETGAGAFGRSVALSGDGNTALIGGPRDNPFANNPIPEAASGAAWVFSRSGASWTQQGGKLTGSGEVGPGRFGYSVSLSADGGTAMIGAPNNEFCLGGAWILARSGEAWSQQAVLHGVVETSACDDGPDDGSLDEIDFGTGVALSADGDVALVSAPFLEPALRPGGTWSYERAASSWAGKTELLARSGVKAGATAVAVSADGRQVLVGSGGDVPRRETALAFVRAGSEWAQESTVALPGDGVGPSSFGLNAALSSAGDTALIGGPSDNGAAGAAWVFSKQVLPPPTVLTGVASGLMQTSAALSGTVNPNGQEVFNCHFEVGPTASYGSNAPCSTLPGAGESPVGVSASAKGLTPNTTYHYRLAAAGGGGVAYGADETLTTLPGPPAVLTGPASSITQTAATLNATVNPLGETVSDCHFEYGPTASYGASAPCSSPPGSGSDPVEVSSPVAGLGEYRPYHFRIVATNAIGTSYGSDHTFNTLSNAPEYGKCGEVAAHAGLYANSICTKWGTGARYEWHPGALGVHFTTKLTAGTVSFETVKRSLITCKTENGSGEFAGIKTLGGVSLTFTGCEYLGQKCTSTLAGEGEIVTNPLEGVLGVERLGKTSSANKIGVELFPAGSAAAFMEFSCGLTAVTLRGGVIAPVVANKMLVSTTLKYSASGGKQHPEHFLAEPAAVLEASIDGRAYEQAGMRFEATQTNSAPVETNSVA